MENYYTHIHHNLHFPFFILIMEHHYCCSPFCIIISHYYTVSSLYAQWIPLLLAFLYHHVAPLLFFSALPITGSGLVTSAAIQAVSGLLGTCM